MVGAGDEDHIITRVIPGTDPLQEFNEDDPTDVITIDHETDESDVDDLSEVSMTSADAMTKEELQGLLTNVATSQQKAAEAIDTLAARVGEMMTDQVSQVHSLFKSICRSGANPEKVLRIRGGAMQVYHHNQ